ncbi:MAG: hypothetical protein AB7I25_08010 [Vicinamibacterales bacterium]
MSEDVRGADLRRPLEGLRTRAGLTGVAATTLPVGLLTWGLVDLLRVFALDGAWARAALTLPATGLVAAAAALVAWTRRPALTEVARTADRRLGLQASVVTAWQFRGESDAFTRRTHARAVDGLRGAPPDAVYPWRLSRAGRACLSLGVAAALGAVLVPHAGTPVAPEGAPAGTAGRVTVPAQRDAATARPAAAATPSSSTAAAPPVDPPRPPATAGPVRPPERATSAPPRPAPPAAGARVGRDARGALTTSSESDTGTRGAAAAPGGARIGGDGPGRPGRSAPDDRPAPPLPAQVAATHAPGLERVPMARRAYVRRYLLSRAETR